MQYAQLFAIRPIHTANPDASGRHAQIKKPRLHAKPGRIRHQPNRKWILKGFFHFTLIQRTYIKINNIDVKILKKDFFDVDLGDATHIFTYLFPSVMDDLIPKLDSELKNGTRLVSASFHFTSKREIKEIDLKRKKYQLAGKIYVYEF